MARNDESDLRTQTNTVIARLGDKTFPKLPVSLAPDVKAFRAAALPFLAAATDADGKLQARDAALSLVGDADAVLDVSIDDLAAAMVGAKLGSRMQPFKGLSLYSPSALKELAYKKEVDETRKLLTALGKKNPPAAMKSIIAKVKKNADAVATKLDALTGPEAGYVKARGKREGLVPGLSKALSRFKLKARAGLVDEPETYAALFAPRSAVQAPVNRKRKAAGVVPPVVPIAPVMPVTPTAPTETMV